ncbi:Protein of unknown function [Microbulbifer donghaiensis]|uniref:DUF3549 domain-containing protein n=1 Tax=Microbulbifer donghaiensis TaxID=494016 RepID=A0A1M5CFH2_9GAMM|nr:DUF3549 family protein [Microbulbifer donghaiensis]SHF53416.1 Protein of unknown function [Microbulbifer donghaiensis]
MSESTTLSALIGAANFKLRWFDLGRRLQPVSRATADAFEAGQAPWPFPYLRQAWAALLLWPEEGGEPVVWFLRLPLDEQGKLQLQARDAFLRQLAMKLKQSTPSESAAQQLHAALEESGLLFTPAPERQASFHSRAALLLKREPSSHYTTALAYFREPQSLPWDQLAIQGIADVAARWEADREILLQQLPTLAPPVFISLCQCLENEATDHQLAAGIIKRAGVELDSDSPDFAIITAAVRGVSHSVARGMRLEFLTRLLNSAASANGEVLAAIGSRCAYDLADRELASLWLAALAQLENQSTFNLLMSDLMFLPQVRSSLLDALRDPARPEALARAFGEFLHGPKPVH